MITIKDNLARIVPAAISPPNGKMLPSITTSQNSRSRVHIQTWLAKNVIQPVFSKAYRQIARAVTAIPVGTKVLLVSIVKPVITPSPSPMESLAASILPLAKKVASIMAAQLVRPVTPSTCLLPHVQPAIKMATQVKAVVEVAEAKVAVNHR
jgi:hypothetical protein